MTRKLVLCIPAVLALLAPASLPAQQGEGDSYLLAAINDFNDVLRAEWMDLRAEWMDLRVQQVDVLTVGQGRASARLHRQPFRWVAGDHRRRADGNNLTYLVDTSDLGASGLDATATETAIDLAMGTWSSDDCLQKVQILKRPASEDADIFDSRYGYGSQGNYRAADIVHAGWLPASFFEQVTGPGGGETVLALSVTFIYVDGSGHPTDLDRDGHLDTAHNEIYYNERFSWTAGGGSGMDVQSVALHEIGHSLGIGHMGPPPEAVMNPIYAGSHTSLYPLDHAALPGSPVIRCPPVKLSTRTTRIGESATLKVTRRASELRARGVSVIDFGAGEPDFPSPAVAVEAARRALAEGFTRYTPGSGLPELRAELAESHRRRYGAPWAPAQSVVTVGGKAALFELALALFEGGQEVIVPAPCWVSFPEQIRFADAEPVLVPTCGEDGFRIHAGPILEAVTDRTRAILLNSPCNPTGGIVSAGDLREIVAAAAERGLLVISDETYERFVYDEAHASAACLAAEFPETVVLVGSFSKTFAMTGWRIGYLLGPRGVVQAVEAIQSHATSNATSFAMVGALEALRHAEGEIEGMVAEYRARRAMLVPRLNQLPGFRCEPPHGAFYAFPRVADAFRPGREDSVALAEFLLEKAGVAVVPGAAFGSDEHIRISFACSRATLEEGLERMAAVLAD